MWLVPGVHGRRVPAGVASARHRDGADDLSAQRLPDRRGRHSDRARCRGHRHLGHPARAPARALLPGGMTEAAARQAAVRQGLSVGVATALYGLSLGAVAVASGLSIWQACVTSLLLFSGGSQFALVGVLGGGGSVGAAVAASSLL